MMQKARESAALLLGIGIVALLPPIALIFAKPLSLWGVPLPVLYIFGLWLALIFGVRLVTRRMPSDTSE